MTWQGDFAIPPFETALGGSKNDEDWEDWLRWDPGADAASPINDFSQSGSSKNDSPVQASAYPVSEAIFDKFGPDDTLAPPLVVGEDHVRLNADSLDHDLFAFGAHAAPGHFNFDASYDDGSNNIPKQAIAEHDWSLNQASNTLLPLQTAGQRILPSSGPPTVTTPSFQHSPGSSTGPRTSLSSHPSPDPPKKRGGRKRKIEAKSDQDDNGDSQDGDEPPVKKTSHNVIEKRYRNNLNDKIVELRNSVPSLRALGRTGKGQNSEDLEGLTPAHKHNKATIMAKATEYIHHLEKRNKTMQDEMDALKAKLNSVEAAFSRSRSRQSSIVGSPPNGTMRPREMSAGAMHGFLSVPQTYPQPQYLQQQSSPVYARSPNPPVEAQNIAAKRGPKGNAVSKLMLGGMAGLMMMEGMNNDQGTSSPHGLGMLPGFGLLKRSGFDDLLSVSAAEHHRTLPLLKVFLVISTLLYLVLPLLSWTRSKQAVRPTIRLPQAPSLASPVEVRRKAWLTAIQTVWVPKHFLLEVVSVLSKMFKMFLRRIIGTELFASLIGANKDDEAARIKAWDIAIDAQLAGGDAEVSYYRLLLTLMASGTLPDSPTRLMQKAVHFRVFFWEVANAGYGNLVMFKQFTEKVGRFYWESARRLQKELVADAQASPRTGDNIDPLPDHLASLLELECDDVLSDEMIQRAWNLAWNKPSANGLAANETRDSVVMDHAIRSPLDAVAAWYSNMLVDETIAETFGSSASKIDMEYHLNLATSIAPPASSTQSRALATKAVLSRSNRTTNIVAALDALPGKSPSNAGMNFVSHTPASPEVQTTLTMAKLVSLYSKTSAAPAARANIGDMLSRFSLPPQSFTLLTAVATFQLLDTYSRSKSLHFAAAQGLEDLACSLRIWIGTPACRQAGLDDQERAEIVDRCVELAKTFGGWSDQDSGYGSSPVSKEGSPAQAAVNARSVVMA